MSRYASSASSGYGSQGSRPAASQAEINQMVQTIQQRRVNTIRDLRRIERTLSGLDAFTHYYMQPMTDAWSHYVNSNNFLNELRELTRQYPFSSEMLENAKVRVFNDAESRRSWNFAWLLLSKIKSEGMVQEYATRTAHQPEMWGGLLPDAHNAAELARVLTAEWTQAVDKLLRHWQTPPTTDGGY
ncbi:hypothetical protein EDC01DRAFT_612492 [Geopyxis carbonaria]|nr:hypothetical protein EDC01DRAFT_612492 [Geopyxis carbonaria]